MLSITFQGSEAIAAKMQALSVEVRQASLLDAVLEAAGPMRDDMARRAPRGDRSPHLADNIKVAKLSRWGGERFNAREGKVAVAIGPPSRFNYALPLEQGWLHSPDKKPQPARPFARPAFEAGKQTALETISRRLWDILTGRGRTGAGLL